MKQYDTISINKLEESRKGPVWVINQSTGRSRGDVLFICAKTTGTGTDTVKVPMTFLPINLTEQVTRKQLLESSEFRRAISIGLVSVIHDNDAEEMNRMAGAAQERKRLFNDARMVTEDTRNEGLGMVSEGHRDTPDSEGKIDGITPAVVVLGEGMEEKEPIEIVNSLRTMESDLTVEDYEYIRSRAINAGHKKLAKYCKNKIEENA